MALYRLNIHGSIEIGGDVYHKGTATINAEGAKAEQIEKHRKGGLLEVMERIIFVEPKQAENKPVAALSTENDTKQQESEENAAQGEFDAESDVHEPERKIKGRTKFKLD